MNEEWRPVVGYEQWYEISSLGRLRRLFPSLGTTVGRIRKYRKILPNGYAQIRMNVAGRFVSKYVHQMVAEAFLGPRKEGMEVNHKDRDRANNVLSNLEWSSRLQNVRHSSVPKLKIRDVKAIKYQLMIGRPGSTKIARMFGVGASTIDSIRAGRSWKDVEPKKSAGFV